MKFEIVDGPTLGKMLNKTTSGTDTSVKLAVAYIGYGAVDLLGGGDMNQSQIVCDYVSGGTNPAAVEALIEAGADVKHLDGLHAKIGIVGNALSFVGSANLSRNGIADDPQINRHERVVVFEGVEKTVANDWQYLWDLSSEISDEMKVAAAAWRLRQRHNLIEATTNTQSNLIDVLVSSPDLLDALNVHMVVYEELTEEEKPAFEKGKAKVQKQNFESVEAYWNWQELPENGFLVDFYKPARSSIGYCGLYYRDTSKFIDAENAHDSFQAAVMVHSMHGIVCESQDQAKIKRAFYRYREDNHPSNADGAWCFPVSELANYLDDA